MSGVRPFRLDDLPAVVALRPYAFRTTLQESADALARYFTEIFTQPPWHDEGLPSLVYEDRAGGIRGFIGVVGRRMRLGTAELRVAVPTQFMVHPEHRGIAGIQLMRAFLNGPQDLALSDRGNNAARLVWERLGGATSTLYSLLWARPLRPVRYAAVTRSRNPFWRGVIAAARPLWPLFDATIGALADAGVPAAPPGSLEPLDPAWAVAHFAEFQPRATLQPVYDEALFRRLLEQSAVKVRLGTMRALLVRDATPGREPLGWFIYFANARGISQVVQLVARADRSGQVLGHLLACAGADGATAVHGRVEPRQLGDLGAARCRFTFEGPWLLMHARDPAVLDAIHGGRSFISRLDSEWWLNF